MIEFVTCPYRPCATDIPLQANVTAVVSRTDLSGRERRAHLSCPECGTKVVAWVDEPTATFLSLSLVVRETAQLRARFAEIVAGEWT